jgi:hypothetical protein
MNTKVKFLELLRDLNRISRVSQKICYPCGPHIIICSVLNSPGLPVPGFYMDSFEMQRRERSIDSHK